MSTPSSKLDQYETHFNKISNDIFSKAPYQWQTELRISSILHTKLNTDDDIHQLCCVRPTGGRKSLLFTTLAVCLGNLTLAITPLLSLGADQTIKHQRNTFGEHQFDRGTRFLLMSEWSWNQEGEEVAIKASGIARSWLMSVIMHWKS